MKIQCDVCEKEEASVFCSADEAALCGRCDRRVHHANKLAGKHLRFSLLSPSSSSDSPLCDICQERRGFVFCQEDRAILCRECDIPVHKANEHTEKHNRFLLSSVKLSAAACSYDTSVSSNGSNLSTETDMKSSVSKSNSGEKTLHYSSTPTTTPNWEVDDYHSVSLGQEGGSVSTSSISEYLMETLPGWHVDDFLDPSSSSPHGFCKVYNHALPFDDLECNMGSLSSEHLSIWVPQPSFQSHHYHHQFQQTGALNGQKIEGSEEVDSTMKGSSTRKWSSEDCFEVPRFINPPSINKRSRQ
ncbi:hypothetical protein LguiA_027560 [Lonicera macranthoides]